MESFQSYADFTWEGLMSTEIYGVPGWFMLLLGLIMFGGWTGAYLVIWWNCLKNRTYGIPIVNIGLNFSWEIIFAFNLAGGLPKFFFPLRWGHLFWLLPDMAILYQVFAYGRDQRREDLGVRRGDPDPFAVKYFHGLLAVTLVACFLVIYTSHFYLRDVYGMASAWIINVLMSGMFILMYYKREERLQGMPVWGAQLRGIGTAGGALFCFFWWPAQFRGGNPSVLDERLLDPESVVRITELYGQVVEPPTYSFLYVIYITNILLDIWLIVMLRKRHKRIAEEQQEKIAAVLEETAPA